MIKSLFFKAAFIIMALASGVICAKGAQDATVALEEDFDAFTEGAVGAPAGDDIADVFNGKLSELLPGWRGSEVYEAGGSLCVGSDDLLSTEAYLQTPSLQLVAADGNIRVEMRVKSLSDAGNIILAGSRQLMVYDGDWHDIVYVTDQSMFNLRLAGMMGGFYIDYLKIEQGESFVVAPEAERPVDFDGMQFTARWSAVSEADAYLLDVYTKDADGTKHYIEQDRRETGTSAVIAVPDANGLYFYTVKAQVGENVSLPSDEQDVVRRVDALDVPVALPATAVTSQGFTANWEAVDNAGYYVVSLYESKTLDADKTVEVLDEGFDGIKDGSFESVGWPVGMDEMLDNYTEIPGWYAFYHAYAEGMLVLNPLGQEAYLETPVVGLSQNNGAYTVAVTMAENNYGDFYTGGVVLVEAVDAVSGEIVETQELTIDTESMKQYQVNFANGRDNMKLRFSYSGSQKMFIDAVTVSQQYKAGNVIKTNIQEGRTGRESLSYGFRHTMVNGVQLSYTVTAYVATINDNGEDVEVASAPSNEVVVGPSETGPANISLTFASIEEEVEIGVGGSDGTTFQVDWGDGVPVEYEGAVVISRRPESRTVLIYGEDLLILQVIDQGLEALDVTNAPGLSRIQIGMNQVKELDVRNNTSLTGLYCEENQISSLDVSKNVRLRVLDCHANRIEGTLDCGDMDALTDVDCSSNLIDELLLPATDVLMTVDCGANRLETLDVSMLPNLLELNCNDNLLTILDVSANTLMTDLYCPDNQLVALDVSANTQLTDLTAFDNAIESIDLSANTALSSLYLQNNNLTSIETGGITGLSWVNLENNRLSDIDLSSFSRLSLLNLGHNELTTIDLSNNLYVNTLHLGNNQIDKLDVTMLGSLIWLTCDSNRIAELDLSHNSYISWLECESNRIAELDLSALTNLQKLFAGHNMLTGLDVSANKNLQGLFVEGNNMDADAINRIIDALPDVSAVEVQENNVDWAKRLNISYMPGTKAARKDDAEAKGWIVTAEVSSAVAGIAADQGQLRYDAATRSLLSTVVMPHIAVYRVDGALMAESENARAVLVDHLPQGMYVAVGHTSSGQTVICKFIR